MICPKCSSDQTKKNGKKTGYQNYYCKDCRNQWQPDKPIVQYEYKETNATLYKYTKNTYKTIGLRLRFDTYGDLIKRMEDFEQKYPEKGDLQKKIAEVLDEHFPRVATEENK